MQSLRLRSGELCFPFFRADYLHKLYGIPYGRFVFSPTIIYLLNHYQSSINISMESNVGVFFFFGCLCYLALLLCSKLILYLPSSVLDVWIVLLENGFRNLSECHMCLLLKGCQYFYTHSDDREQSTCVYTDLCI